MDISIGDKQKKNILNNYNMKQKITQMKLARYLFTAVLALLFISCSKGLSSDDPYDEEQTTSSNQVEDKISPNDYLLSDDGLTLIKWTNLNSKNLNMNLDPRLRKVQIIGKGAFVFCTSLTSVIIPRSVASFDYSVFSGCRNLTRVTFRGNNPPTIAYSAFILFRDTSSDLKLIVPKGAKSAYIKAGYPEDKLVEQ